MKQGTVRQIRSELMKVRTTRTFGGLLAGAAALTLLATWATMSETSATVLHTGFASVLPAIGILYIVTLFVLVFGVRSYTDEHRHGSIVPTLLSDPHRRRVVVAKVTVAAICSVVFTLLTLTVGSLFTAGWMVAKGAPLAIAWGALGAIVLKGLLAGILWSVIGVGVGVAVQHQVAAIVGALVWLLVAEQLLGGFLPKVARFLPSHLTDALFGASGAEPLLLAPVLGGVLLAGWALVSAGLGTVFLERRDIA